MGCWIAYLANKLPLYLRPRMRQLPAISAHVCVMAGMFCCVCFDLWWGGAWGGLDTGIDS